ncbi:MAG TPA: hypothetical protein VM406_09125, partial [Noviherbaspirillum sp.]|nr:hypothetical protein [Noviherbaspirillum sp.]
GGTVALPIWTDYMRVALRGVGPVHRAAPGGLAQVDGDLMYAEYAAAGNSVRSVGIDEIRSFWERLFRWPSQPSQPSQPAPSVAPAPIVVPPAAMPTPPVQRPVTPRPVEERRLEEWYRG